MTKNAEEKIEKSRILEVVEKQPKQSQAVLFAIIALLQDGEKTVETGEVYDRYSEVCKSVGLTALTQRRVSDLLAELDMLGVINARVISKGRYGRTREINLAVDRDHVNKISNWLEDDLELK